MPNYQDLERVQNMPITYDDIINKMELYCSMIDLELNDLIKEPESRFVWVLKNVGLCLFAQNKDILKFDSKINNQYDPEKLDIILNIYLDLCIRFNKIPSMYGYVKFLNIDYSYIVSILHDAPSCSVNVGGVSSNAWRNINKKILNEREINLRQKLTDGKQNPVGIIAVMNNEYNLNGDKPESTQDRKTISVNDLKQILSITNGQHKINEYSKIAQQNPENVENTGVPDNLE